MGKSRTSSFPLEKTKIREERGKQGVSSATGSFRDEDEGVYQGKEGCNKSSPQPPETGTASW